MSDTGAFLSGLELAEMTFAASGVAHIDLEFDQVKKATFLRLINANYRASEALALMEPHRKVPLIRALVARGKVAEAAHIFRNIDQSARISGDEDPETTLERARMYAASGRWNEVIVECGRVLTNRNTSMLGRSAAHQVRANAWLEVRQYDRAASDLEHLNTFSSLLPYGQIAFYGRAARVKITARTEGVESGREEFNRIFRNWKDHASRANLDEFFTLVRIALDLHRLDQKDHSDLALACVNLAKALGDETYVGLAYLDLWASVHVSDRGKIASALSPYLKSQPRVQTIFEETRTRASNCFETSMRLAGEIARKSSGEGEKIARHCDVRIEKILCVKSSVLACLSDRTVSKIEIQPRMRSVIEHLARGPIEKDALFKGVWGICKYDPNRHDTLIRTAIKRARKQTGLEVHSVAGRISLSPNVLILAL